MPPSLQSEFDPQDHLAKRENQFPKAVHGSQYGMEHTYRCMHIHIYTHTTHKERGEGRGERREKEEYF